MLNPKTTIKVNSIIDEIVTDETEKAAIKIVLGKTICETFVSNAVNEEGGYSKMRAVENAQKNWKAFAESFKSELYKKFGDEIKAMVAVLDAPAKKVK